MYVKCPKCGSELQPDEMNLEKKYAKCRSCYTFLNLEAFERREIVIPSDIDLEQDEAANTLTISWSWYSNKAIMWGLACGLLIIFFFLQKHPAELKWPPIFQVFITVSLAYYSMALFLNKTVISVENDRLSIGFTPLPWFRSYEFAKDSLEQLFTQEYYVGRGHRHGLISYLFPDESPRGNYNYSVKALLTNGKEVTLVSGLREPEEALFIEQRLERCLGIEDRPVPGEYPH